MDPRMQEHARSAIAAVEKVLEAGPRVEHAEIQAATKAVIAFRNRAIEQHRAGSATRDCLDRANALASLAYGGQFPLSGLHLHRLEQTRDGLQDLLEREAPGRTR